MELGDISYMKEMGKGRGKGERWNGSLMDEYYLRVYYVYPRRPFGHLFNFKNMTFEENYVQIEHELEREESIRKKGHGLHLERRRI